MGSSSTRKYLIYAAGEIALVVIGILIALQINNWNEYRKNRNEEKQVFKAISKDLARMHDYIQVCRHTHQAILNASERLLNVIHRDEKEINAHQMELDLMAIFKRCFVGEGLSENIYDVLMGSDQLELLTSRELRDELAYLDSWIGTLQPYDILQAEFVDNHLKPFINQYIDRTGLIINTPSLSTVIDTSVFEKRFQSHYEELLAQRSFVNLLTDLIIHTRGVVGVYDFIEGSISSIDSILVVEMPNLNTEIIARSNK